MGSRTFMGSLLGLFIMAASNNNRPLLTEGLQLSCFRHLTYMCSILPTSLASMISLLCHFLFLLFLSALTIVQSVNGDNKLLPRVFHFFLCISNHMSFICFMITISVRNSRPTLMDNHWSARIVCNSFYCSGSVFCITNLIVVSILYV